MLQRVQSIYLLLVTVLMSLLLVWSYADITLADNHKLEFYTYAIQNVSADEVTSNYKITFPVALLIVIIGIVSFVNIFLYSRRIVQLRFCLINTILLIVLLAFMITYYITTKDMVSPVNHSFRFPSICPPAAILLTILAYRAIQHDEFLVKSYDRVR
jgi:hypothetical protein